MRLRKYHDRLDTHLTSRSLVMTPDWSIDLKRMVKGKGNFTATSQRGLFPKHLGGHIQITKPEKKALIQLMIKV